MPVEQMCEYIHKNIKITFTSRFHIIHSIKLNPCRPFINYVTSSLDHSCHWWHYWVNFKKMLLSILQSLLVCLFSIVIFKMCYGHAFLFWLHFVIFLNRAVRGFFFFHGAISKHTRDISIIVCLNKTMFFLRVNL